MSREHCPFRKTILGGSCACSLALKTHLPTGCSVSCKDDAAWDQCEALLDEMITAAKFVLQYIEDSESLTHGKLLRIQHGGLFGLARLLYNKHVTQIDDVHCLVNDAKQEYHSLGAIPYQELLDDIANWQLKRRRSKK